MTVTDKEHFNSLREADQRAVELLAKANAARISMGLLIVSLLVSMVSVLVAVITLIFHK